MVCTTRQTSSLSTGGLDGLVFSLQILAGHCGGVSKMLGHTARTFPASQTQVHAASAEA